MTTITMGCDGLCLVDRSPMRAPRLLSCQPLSEAFVVAVPTPHFAVTAADGTYTIPDVPDGTYILKVWHLRLKAFTQNVTVSGDTTFDAALPK